jgi:hypothetical protein
MPCKCHLSVGRDRGISARADEEENSEGREGGLSRGGQDIPWDEESDCRYLEKVKEDVGKGRIGTEHRVVSCGKGSCGEGWIDCQAAPTKRHGQPEVQPPTPTPNQGPSPYRHKSITKTPPYPALLPPIQATLTPR